MYAKKIEIGDANHVAFLLYWLCHHIAYYGSKKFIKAYFGLVVALHQETEVVMGLFVLAHIFRGMNDLIALEDDDHSWLARGLIWMMQI